MKLSIEHALAAIAIAAIAFHFGRRRAAAATNGQANQADQAGEWWSYAPSWSL